ncbi:phage baseplate assembly protein [Burkholderia sp. WAC0059]|uniref:phage baseplate assembly protein n=1 Tax=Burkholderia sp. WAC0059 TaxID=2066022 RepID=UPI00215577AF|nr:Mu P family protein [Burkholderia sp. WAC0059]
MDDGDLSLIVGGRTISGWTDIRLTRGVERCPSDFELGLTDSAPDSVSEVTVQPGDACEIRLGNDLVLTGYVDRFVPSYSPGSHQIRVSGRGKCQDLVDCSAVWPNSQMNGTSALDIATKLAAHYGITVSCDVPNLVAIPLFNVLVGETPLEVIERVSRFSQLLVYDGPDGNLILAQATQQAQAVGGVFEGVNVQSASVAYSADERYRDYVCFAQSVATLSDAGVGPIWTGSAQDENVKRPREHYVVCEAPQGYSDLAQRRATWEMNRRAGRSAIVSAVVDSWRDGAGALWTPNTLVTVSLPHLKLQPVNWLISEVTYQRSLEGGTTAQLAIMDPRAFLPEPIVLLPLFVDLSVYGSQ